MISNIEVLERWKMLIGLGDKVFEIRRIMLIFSLRSPHPVWATSLPPTQNYTELSRTRIWLSVQPTIPIVHVLRSTAINTPLKFPNG
jgi:hypothetical protein